MRTPEITVVDYGVGNLLSVSRGLEHCGAKVNMSSDPEFILKSKKVILPGVGAFPNGMRALIELGLDIIIKEVVKKDIPLLGICLGMQLLLDESQEFGVTKGLGVIPGKVVPIPNKSMDGKIQKIPHIGWNSLVNLGAYWQNTILQEVREGDAAYFVHSFMASPEKSEDRLADVSYGGHRISAVIAKGNTMGCQFHPEKSGEIGLKILRNFIKL
jgi:glutamine amidotransferase